MNFVIKTLYNCEPILAAELEVLGAKNIRPGNRLVECSGDLAFMYEAVLKLRTALRVLVPVTSFRAKNPDTLYEMVYGKAWEDIIKPTQTFAIDPVVYSEFFKHSRYAALKVKDAIVDKIRDKTGDRPSIDTRYPGIKVHVYINEDNVSIYLDASGFSLNQRNYRAYSVDAPINEVLAAALLLKADYKGDRAFIDPMAGSGTFAIEAAMIASNTPPQINNERFCFKNWANYDEELWTSVLTRAKEAIKEPDHPIIAADNSFKAYKALSANVMSSGMENYIDVERVEIEKLAIPIDNTLLVCNPPYDERISLENPKDFYEMIGSVLKAQTVPMDAWFITNQVQTPNFMRLKAAKRHSFMNGEFRCKFFHFEIYGKTVQS